MNDVASRATTWMRAKGLADPAIIAAITIFTGVLSGSERWAGLDTPDSSFYASLGLFGDEVTDRSVEQSYYWTRLGYLVPVRVLTGALGPWTGFAAYRLILLLAIVAAVYLTMRRFTTRPSAAFITTAISLNTVVLSYLGNTYLTGSVLAGTAALIALALNDRRAAAVVAGFVLGWLIMVNPVGALLSGTIWLTIRIHARTRLSHLGFAAAMTVATFGAFLLTGRLMFPRMDWFETFFATQQITLSNFASKSPVWLGDISLLVPAGILVISVVAWALNRGSRPAQLALMISSSSIAFMLVFTPLMGGIALEAPMYQAMLWPPALIALGLVIASAVGDRRWTPAAYGCAAIALAAVLLAGHWPGAVPFALGVAAIVVLVAAVILGVRSRQLVITLLALAVFLAGAQLLQNSRGPLGLYYLSPYNWAFNANPVSDKVHTAVNTQEWLLSNTSPDDRILDWVGGDWVGGDRELYVVAGMQLWGENRVTLEPVLTPDDVARLDSLRPSVVAMYAPSQARVTAFWASIPEANRASLPICYDFAWAPSPDTEAAKNPAPVTEGHACLTRLTWAD